jgi:hypothetical protein
MKFLFGLLAFGASTAPAMCADEVPKGEKVEFKVYGRPYFEKNTSELTGDASFLAIGTQAGFDKVFGVGFVMGKKPDLIPKDGFSKKLVVAAIKRANAVYEYKIESVTAADGVLYVKYTAEGKGAGGMAKFASPLIIAVDKKDYKSVVFIENGKKVGTAEFKK